MEKLESIWSWITKCVGDSKPVKAAFYFYVGVVCVGTVYGSFRGFISWVKWRQSRKTIKIANQTLQPIVNNSVDAGKLGLNVLMSGLMSGFVVASAPISVPIIIMVLKEPEVKEKPADKQEENKEILPPPS